MKSWKLLKLTIFLHQFPPTPPKTKKLSSPPIYLKARASHMLLIDQSNLTKYSMVSNGRRQRIELVGKQLRVHLGRLRLHEMILTQFTMKGQQMSTRSSKPILSKSTSTTRFITTKLVDTRESWIFSSLLVSKKLTSSLTRPSIS